MKKKIPENDTLRNIEATVATRTLALSLESTVRNAIAHVSQHWVQGGPVYQKLSSLRDKLTEPLISLANDMNNQLNLPKYRELCQVNDLIGSLLPLNATDVAARGLHNLRDTLLKGPDLSQMIAHAPEVRSIIVGDALGNAEHNADRKKHHKAGGPSNSWGRTFAFVPELPVWLEENPYLVNRNVFSREHGPFEEKIKALPLGKLRKLAAANGITRSDFFLHREIQACQDPATRLAIIEIAQSCLAFGNPYYKREGERPTFTHIDGLYLTNWAMSHMAAIEDPDNYALVMKFLGRLRHAIQHGNTTNYVHVKEHLAVRFGSYAVCPICGNTASLTGPDALLDEWKSFDSIASVMAHSGNARCSRCPVHHTEEYRIAHKQVTATAKADALNANN